MASLPHDKSGAVVLLFGLTSMYTCMVKFFISKKQELQRQEHIKSEALSNYSSILTKMESLRFDQM